MSTASHERDPSPYASKQKPEIHEEYGLKSQVHQYEASATRTDELLAPNDESTSTEDQHTHPLIGPQAEPPSEAPQQQPTEYSFAVEFSGWSFKESSQSNMVDIFNSSQIRQNNQTTPIWPSQPESNPVHGNARSWWRLIKKYLCLCWKT